MYSKTKVDPLPVLFTLVERAEDLLAVLPEVQGPLTVDMRDKLSMAIKQAKVIMRDC